MSKRQPTINKRPDGRLCLRIGKKYIYGQTVAEVIEKRNAWLKDQEEREKEKTAQEDSKHDAVCDDSFEDASFRGYAIQWIKAYRNDCGARQQKQYASMAEYAAIALGNKKLKDITTIDLQMLCNKISGYSPSYTRKFVSILRGIYRTAVSDGIVLRNLMDNVKMPKTKKAGGHRALDAWERELVLDTCTEHDFGLVAATMMLAGLRRGEALYLDVDRDIDFFNKTISVRGAASFGDGNQAVVTQGKTESAIRTLPLVEPLEKVLKGHHGLLCAKSDGKLMSLSAFDRKWESYISFLETKINGCHKRWYGKTREHRALLAEGKTLPPWKDVTIRCHDFRVDFCTRAYEAGIPLKTLQVWMGHADSSMVLNVYTKLTVQHEKEEAAKITQFMSEGFHFENTAQSVNQLESLPYIRMAQ